VQRGTLRILKENSIISSICRLRSPTWSVWSAAATLVRTVLPSCSCKGLKFPPSGALGSLRSPCINFLRPANCWRVTYAGRFISDHSTVSWQPGSVSEPEYAKSPHSPSGKKERADKEGKDVD